MFAGTSAAIPLDPNVVIALIAGAVAITTASFVFLNSRMSDLRRRVDAAEQVNQALWVYCRRLIDFIYKHTGQEPPAPDESITHLFPKD
jgi:hypothetical protein